ncbi:hypothetical protein MMC24_003799 [Lignoscripta atroalba]|nr:hypothetical protein [Lignoscripta atroalba]
MAQRVDVSATKRRLMQALGLSQGTPAHEEIYVRIKTECSVGYDTICADRRNLKPEHANVPGRFTYGHMTAAAIDNAIVQIYRNAHPTVRQWYTHWGVDGSPSNWIIRWFLYHAFRNRDARNERKARSTDFHSDDDEGDDKAVQSTTSSAYYDAARNGYH